MTSKSDRGADGRIPVKSYRFEQETLSLLDEIAAHLQHETGTPSNHSAAIRYAVRRVAADLRKKESRKKGD